MYRSIGLALAVSGFSMSAFAQAAPIPRAADGRPDLQGVWSANIATPLQRPEGVTALTVTAEQAKKLIADANDPGDKLYDPDFDEPIAKITKLLEMHGELRSSLIIEPPDGKLPMTALAKAAVAQRKQFNKSFDNPEERPAGERCLSSAGDPPLLYLSDLIPSQIVQTPTGIAVGTEDSHGGRVIDMDGGAPPDAVRGPLGHSGGRWEGDILVVVTDHFAVDDPAGVQFRDAAMISRASRVIERFELISPDELLYRFTIEDPALYSAPWLAEVMLRRAPGPVYEYACHEGNYALTHILTAARLGRQKPAKDHAPKTAVQKKADKTATQKTPAAKTDTDAKTVAAAKTPAE